MGTFSANLENWGLQCTSSERYMVATKWAQASGRALRGSAQWKVSEAELLTNKRSSKTFSWACCSVEDGHIGSQGGTLEDGGFSC